MEEYSDNKPYEEEEVKEQQNDEWSERYEQLEKEHAEKIAELEEKCTRFEAQVSTSLQLSEQTENIETLHQRQ